MGISVQKKTAAQQKVHTGENYTDNHIYCGFSTIKPFAMFADDLEHKQIKRAGLETEYVQMKRVKRGNKLPSSQRASQASMLLFKADG